MTMKMPITEDLATMMPLLWFGPGAPPPREPPSPRTETVVLVHPDRWDAFWMAINQPDIFTRPEVRALLVPDATPPSP